MNKPKVRVNVTNDGLVNVISGLGTAKSKTANNQWQMGLIGGNQYALEASYQSNWISQKIVDCRAEDMTRAWRRIKCEDAEMITAVEDNLNVSSAVLEALKWARLFGGAGILMVTDQPFDKPLNLNRIKKGSLTSLVVFDRWDMHGMDFNLFDFMSPNYQRPTYYTLGTTNAAAQRIHHSHFVRFEGIQLPRRLRHFAQGWGDSVLNRCIEDVTEFVASKGGIAELMQEANVDVINRVGLSEELASGEDDAIVSRYAAYSQMKSIFNMALLDGDETYTRQTLNLSGVAQILEQMLTYISGAADTPVTRMFGTSAKGMNATGEGDMNNYYDSISASQSSRLTEPMRQLDEVLVRSALGYFPETYDYVWNPLGTPNDVELAQAELLRAQKHQLYLDAQVVEKSQIMRELQANEEYQFDDDKLNELEELESQDVFSDLPDVPPADTVQALDAQNVLGYAKLVLNEEDASVLVKHISSLGIESGITYDKMHMTLMYSRDSGLTGNTPEKSYIAKIGKPEIIGEGKYRALVLNLTCPEAAMRHDQLKKQGGKHSYDTFKPHLSVKYGPTDEDLKALIDNPPEIDEITFSNETWGYID